MKKILLWITFVVLICSCSMHPLGIADETWQKMTPEQQAEAYKKQADIDAKERAQKLAYQQQQEQEIANIKANPKYGEYVQCVVNNGKYQSFINEWDDIQSFSFDAIKDKTTSTTLTYYRNNDKFFKDTQNLYISFTGTQIKICKAENSFDNNCSIINATAPQYQRGVNINIDSGVIKGSVQCDMVYKNNKHHRNRGHSDIIINI
ncbi:hypothetical protein LO80_06485 [Candidatus Francisella endociliophora]|uniref:Lipoprotein n=1 Tax=Candidatus Francisella endociliophora TaxID=653937 RepID=A0A097EPZ1_9GAMM|nr:hypothetical protein [Francisella sp. FSC1006]AIT09644.1 hypothetical protein LO80_06485 [Francisella sp. FSC1006]